MGHQFGGNHTFNGTRFSCGGGNRNQSTSVEPGSGSTIMAYAGICAKDDLQPHSDPYFSERSLDEINGYVTSTLNPVNEVQSVALRDFDTDGDSFTLTYNGNTSAPIIRGTNYTAHSIETKIEAIAGGDETVVGFGGVGNPNDDGFQVTFKGDLRHIDVDPLSVTDTSGMSGFVGEIVHGGPPQNGGYTVVDTGNHRPDVSAPAKRTIPVQTPFRLTGGATDSDADPITYTWEQNDDGGTNGTRLVSNTKKNGPLFRQFGTAAIVSPEGTLMSPSPGENAAGPDPTRVFPDMAQIVAGETNAATGACPEATGAAAGGRCRSSTATRSSCRPPTGSGSRSDRTMHFRLTARDGNPVAGGVGFADTAVKLDPDAGPFLVTSQATRSTVTGGTRLTVSWDVAGTNAPPIDASKVTIRLSLDKGKTFPVVLAASTANDGSKKVTLPNVAADHARVMVEAAGNVFFDLSDANLKIEFSPGG